MQTIDSQTLEVRSAKLTHSKGTTGYDEACDRVGIPKDRRLPALDKFLRCVDDICYVILGTGVSEGDWNKFRLLYAEVEAEIHSKYGDDAQRIRQVLDEIRECIDLSHDPERRAPEKLKMSVEKLKDICRGFHLAHHGKLGPRKPEQQTKGLNASVSNNEVVANVLEQQRFESTDTGTKPQKKKSQGMLWEEARDAALKYLVTDGKPWPGRNELARTIGCSPSTLSKACARNAELARIKLEYEQQKNNRVKSVSTQQIPDAVVDSATTPTGQDDIDLELDTMPSDQSDNLIARLEAECRNEEAQKEFARMTEGERLRVAVVAFSDPDSGRDTRNAGGRVRT